MKQDNVEAIYRAGADFVLSYATLGVQSIFALLEGRELIVVGEGTDLFRIPVPARLAGSTLLESEIGARTGLNVIAIESDGVAANNPSPQTRLQKGSSWWRSERSSRDRISRRSSAAEPAVDHPGRAAARTTSSL